MWFINSFHIQILIFELIFAWNLDKRSHFWIRFIPATAAYCALRVLPIHDALVFPIGGWFSFWFLFVILMSGILIWFSFYMSAQQAVFYACVAHTLQHMVHCLFNVIWMALSLNEGLSQGVYLLLMVLFATLSWFVLSKRFSGGETIDIKRSQLIWFACASSIVVYFLSYWIRNYEAETIGMFLFDFLACGLLLIILLDMFRFRKAERENLIMMRILRQEQEQHKISKATVEVIDRKCHDLKHQISALRNMSGMERENSIAELEKSILIYDSFAKSGNEDLDIILAEKSLLCEKQGIKLQCIADGEKLSFMKTEDVYTLMGNALDNAIEAVSQEMSLGRRVITMRITQKGELLTIHIENPCKVQPIFVDGLPASTKADREYHGFGTKSMRYVSEKYGGVLTTDWEKGIFYLDILFPLQ